MGPSSYSSKIALNDMVSKNRHFFLIRHGETNENASGIVQGHSCGTLSERGRQQARVTGEYLKGAGIEKIITSDLDRAGETAEIINRTLGLSISKSNLLRERNSGVFEGHSIGKYRSAVDASIDGFVDFRPAGGESFRDLWLRSELAWKTVMLPALTQTTLFVSHGGFNRCLLSRLLGQPIEFQSELKQENTCINEGEVSAENSVSFIRLNWIKHLTASLQPKDTGIPEGDKM